VSRRRRAIGFGAAALVCAGIAAAMASGYRSDLSAQLGALRAVVVARRALAAHRAITPGLAHDSLELRRVPSRFVPPGALTAAAQALGRAPAGPIPAGAYLLAAQLRAPGSGPAASPASAVGPGREPVEIAVAGAGALAAAGDDPVGERVDVIVTTEPRGAAATGRTYVAAAAVRLLDLSEGGGGGTIDAGAPAGAGGWTATLALTRRQALKLIEAESFAREIRLIGAG
jgi:Flp pilus assembly protein CpaB